MMSVAAAARFASDLAPAPRCFPPRDRPVPATAHANPIGLRLIGGFKFVSGLLLIALAVGLYRHRGDNFADALIRLADALKIDPGNHYIHTLQEKITGITHRQVAGVIIGTFLYAVLYLIEGTGAAPPQTLG